MLVYVVIQQSRFLTNIVDEGETWTYDHYLDSVWGSDAEAKDRVNKLTEQYQKTGGNTDHEKNRWFVRTMPVKPNL